MTSLFFFSFLMLWGKKLGGNGRCMNVLRREVQGLLSERVNRNEEEVGKDQSMEGMNKRMGEDSRIVEMGIKMMHGQIQREKSGIMS